MLDVHPAHHAATTRKDFLVHLATIVLGLLIAIGLEQTVEYFHHRHQVKETREALENERKRNLQVTDYNIAVQKQIRAILAKDMNLLQIRLKNPKASLGGLNYPSWNEFVATDGVWAAAKQNNTLTLMPQQELSHLTYEYDVQRDLMQQLFLLNQELDHAAAIAQRKPPKEFDAQDLKDLIDATSLIQGKLATVSSFLGFARDYAFVPYNPASLEDSSRADETPTPPDFTKNPTIPVDAK